MGAKGRERQFVMSKSPKNHQAAVKKMLCQFADGVDRVRVVHEDEPANDGVK
jgi:hypothetical protein